MHPLRYDLAFDLERNRLTVFFRLLIAIPWILVAYLYSIAALIAVVIAWFALMITKRYPQGLYNFVAGYLRFAGRLGSWVVLGTDELPPFSGKEDLSYPARIEIGPPQAEYRRSHTFFKIVTAFPQMLLSYGVQGLIGAAAFISWWRILFTGKQSATMHDAIRVGSAYYLRSQSFLFLLTETHPRLLDLPPQEYPPGTPALPPAPVVPALDLGRETA